MTARGWLLLTIALALGGCSGGPDRQPEPSGGAGVEAGKAGPGKAGGEAPENLLESRETNQLLLDLDKYTEDWQVAREERRPAAYGSIERLIRRAVEDNLDLLVALSKKEKNPRGRIIASKSLGFTSDPKALEALVLLLSEDDPAILENALMGISLQARATVPAEQIAFHLESFDPRVQRNAAMALYRVVRKGAPLTGRMRERAVARLSVLMLDYERPVLRGNAAAAIGVLGSAENENDLLNLLRDDEVYPRLRAIVALSHLGTESCLDSLIQLLGAAQANVRAMAARALWIVTNRLEYGLDGTVLGQDANAWRAALEARRAGE